MLVSVQWLCAEVFGCPVEGPVGKSYTLGRCQGYYCLFLIFILLIHMVVAGWPARGARGELFSFQLNPQTCGCKGRTSPGETLLIIAGLGAKGPQPGIQIPSYVGM